MSLSSPEYFLFLALLFFAFWLLRRVSMPAIGLILLADYFFYAKWSLIYLAIIPLAGSIDFLIGYLLERSQRPVLRRLLVGTSVGMNIGLIIAGKYVPFLTGGASLPIVLPLGLSFYAFQAMTYTVDIYRGDASAAKSYWKYLASAAFFPTTLAGPITRVSTLVTQWQKGRKSLSSEEGGRALFLIASGLAKKFLIADYLGSNLVNRVIRSTDALFEWRGVDRRVRVRVSALLRFFRVQRSRAGIGTPPPRDQAAGQFQSPVHRRNVADFWRRWHISLSNWLRDYLYFALPGKRSKLLSYLNLVITMTLGGLWHGPNWTFAIWGLLHGSDWRRCDSP